MDNDSPPPQPPEPGSSEPNQDPSIRVSPSMRQINDRKSIMKKEPSKYDTDDQQSGGSSNRRAKTARFDETNIQKTYRPADKDYGFDKIMEPNTPYPREEAPVDADELSQRLLVICEDERRESNADDDDQTPSTSQGATVIETPEPRASVSSLVGEAGPANGGVAGGTGEERSLSFLEKRKKHVRSEFIHAKQASVSDMEETEVEGDQQQGGT